MNMKWHLKHTNAHESIWTFTTGNFHENIVRDWNFIRLEILMSATKSLWIRLSYICDAIFYKIYGVELLISLLILNR